MDAGTVAAGNTANLLRQAEGQNLFRQYGAGAMQGDPNAMNALAGFDPVMAQGMDINRQENRRADQRLSLDQERLSMLRSETARAAAAFEDQADAARQMEEMKRAVAVADGLLSSGSKAGALEALAPFGLPVGLAPEDAMRAAVTILAGTYDGLQARYSGQAPERKIMNIDGVAYDFTDPANPVQLTQPRPKGPESVVNNYLGAPGQEPQVGDVYNPGEVTSTLQLIGEIFTDPSLGRITGPVQGGGGNNPDQLNMVQRMAAGEAGLGTIAKINQVQSRGWLAARQMLKGGGPITDYESQKAEAAVARLTRAQGEAEFKAALKDFHDAIREGMVKLDQAGRLPQGVQIPEPLGVNTVAPSAGASTAAPPPQAVQMLRAEPSMEAMREFDEIFGEGAAAAALRQ
jgi:hypothetical protein